MASTTTGATETRTTGGVRAGSSGNASTGAIAPVQTGQNVAVSVSKPGTASAVRVASARWLASIWLVTSAGPQITKPRRFVAEASPEKPSAAIMAKCSDRNATCKSVAARATPAVNFRPLARRNSRIRPNYSVVFDPQAPRSSKPRIDLRRVVPATRRPRRSDATANGQWRDRAEPTTRAGGRHPGSAAPRCVRTSGPRPVRPCRW